MLGGINSLRNTNWAFTDVNRYWALPTTGLWNSTFSWSLASGGSGNASPPASTHSVVFDGTDGNIGVSSVNTTVSISSLTVLPGYSGTVNVMGAPMTISSLLSQSAGTISLGTAIVTLQGDLDLSAGTFNDGFSTFTLTGTKVQTLDAGMRNLSHLLVNKTGGSATLGSPLGLDGNLTVTLGTFNTGNDYALAVGSNVLINGGTLQLTNSTVTVKGGWVRTSGTFTPGNSAVTFSGIGLSPITSGFQPFNDVIFDGIGSTWTLTTNGLFTTGNITLDDGVLTTGANINVTNGGNFTMNGGVFNMNSSSMSVAGNWSQTGGTINPGGSTVTLTGATPQLAGSSTFYSLTSTLAGQTITFQANSSVTVGGYLTLIGVNGNRISLRSSSPGSEWYLVNTGTSSVSFIDAQDSNADGGRTIRAFTGLDSGGNNL
jgi:hypothetical protein